MQVGKSGGAWITQALLLGLGSLTAALPIISISFVAVVSGWIFAVTILGRQMKVCASGNGLSSADTVSNQCTCSRLST